MKTLRSSSPVATRAREGKPPAILKTTTKSVTRRTVTPSAPLAQKSSIEVGWTGVVQRKDSSLQIAEVVELDASKRRVYVHYVAHDRRNDEWVSLDCLRQPCATPPGAAHKVRTPTSPRQQPRSRKRQRKADHRRTPRGGGLHSSRVDPSVAHLLEEARHKKTAVKNIEAVIFSQWRLEPWYWAPFPEQYHHQSLYFCDWTLRYTTSQILAVEHRTQYKASRAPRRPPGVRCYGPDDDDICLWEVDGENEPRYCQNLCLLAKLFLDHKTLSFDAEPFRFYCLTKKSVGDDGIEEHSLMGYFSKEKVSALNYNLACILTLPQFQRQGVGTLMISLSYALSVRESKVGSPEKPLSDLGKLSYRAYWSYISLKLLEDYDGDLTLKELARTKGLCSEDVISTLEHLGLLREWRGQLVVRADRKDIAQKLAAIKRPPRLCDERFMCWTPPADDSD